MSNGSELTFYCAEHDWRGETKGVTCPICKEVNPTRGFGFMDSVECAEWAFGDACRKIAESIEAELSKEKA